MKRTPQGGLCFAAIALTVPGMSANWSSNANGATRLVRWLGAGVLSPSMPRRRGLSVGVLCAVLLGFAGAPGIASGMSWSLKPLPNGVSLTAISCPSTKECIAVGSGPHGTLNERWTSKGWIPQFAPALPADPYPNGLWSVSCATTSVCTAVGTKGGAIPNDEGGTPTPDLAVVEHWTQSRWSVQPSPSPGYAASEDSDLHQVSCPSVRMCVAVGELDDQYDNSTPFIEIYNAGQWRVSWVGAAASGALTNVSCATANFCVAGGWTRSASSGDPRLIIAWNGHSWTTAALPSLPSNLLAEPQGGGMSGVGCHFVWFCGENAVSCPTVTFCAASGTVSAQVDSGPVPTENMIEFWDGHTWTDQIRPTFSQPATRLQFGISEVSCTSAHVCTALGSAPGARGGSRLEVYHGTGSNWSAQTVTAPAGTQPLALACPSQHTCIGIIGHPVSRSPEAPLTDSTLNLRF